MPTSEWDSLQCSACQHVAMESKRGQREEDGWYTLSEVPGKQNEGEAELTQ